MMRKWTESALLVILAVQPLFGAASGTVQAANPAATVHIDTSREQAIERGMRGTNNEMQKSAMDFLDDDVVREIKDADLGWLRWPGGTNTGNFNWKLGEPDDEAIAQYYGNPNYAAFDENRRLTIAKGQEKLKDFYELSRLTAANIVMVVNAFNETPDDVRDLAKFVKDNGIQVKYWQLGNEPYYWDYIGDNQEGAGNPLFFSSAEDYLNKMKAFNDAIKSELPTAKTFIYYAPTPDSPINDQIAGYPDRYWDGITFHQYEGNSDPGKLGENCSNTATAVCTAIKNTNTALDNWYGRIDRYVAKSSDDVPIIVTEYGVKILGKLEATHYSGLFIAEAVLRASKHPNIKYMGGYRLYNGLIAAADERTDELEDAYQRMAEHVQTMPETTKDWDFAVFNRAPALSLKVVDHAVNHSGAIWDTTVTGGVTVPKRNAPMPALYAQAYKGDDGINYVVITNKSGTTHDVTIQQDGSGVTAPMTKTYVAANNPMAKNLPANPNNVSIRTASTGNPVTIPPYSVTRVEWKAREAVMLPTRLTHAEVVADDSVKLKWWPLDGVSSYTIRYGTSPDQYTGSVTVTGSSEYTVTGLAYGKKIGKPVVHPPGNGAGSVTEGAYGNTFYFAVYPGSASSALSNELSVSFAAPPAPVLRSVYPKRSGELAVEWQSVPGAAGYKVKIGTTDKNFKHVKDNGESGNHPESKEKEKELRVIDVGNVNGYKLTGLTNDTAYYVAVSAYNGIGESDNSDADPHKPGSQPAAAEPKANLAFAPNHLRISAENDSGVTLAWEPSLAEVLFDGFEDNDSAGWTVESGSFSVVDHPDASRKAKVFKSAPSDPDAGTTRLQAAVSGDSRWTDYEAESKVTVDAWNDSGFAGVAARYSKDADNRESSYRFIYEKASNSFNIQKSTGGTIIKLAESAAGDIAAADDLDEMKLKLRVSGSSLTGTAVFNNGGKQIELTAEDSGIVSGKAALVSGNQETYYDQVIVRKPNTDGGSYLVYRSTAPYGGYQLIAAVRATETSYTDTGLNGGTTYYYKVKGANGPDGRDVSIGSSNIVSADIKE